MSGAEQHTVLSQSDSFFSPRRLDIEVKQQKIAKLLLDLKCELVLLLEPANFRWFTSGANVRGVHHGEEHPALMATLNQRWLLCSSMDTQRLFDEELDGFGFQVKEWPWHSHRDSFLADLCYGRKVASDLNIKECKNVGAFFENERRCLSAFEQEYVQKLGQLLAHALEATGRNLERGDREEEVAGHLAHRLLRHGVEPIALQISADQRARNYPRSGFTSATVERTCLLQATVSKYGLFATASRMVCFGPPDESLQQEYEAACSLYASWVESIKANDRPAALFETMRSRFKDTPDEHRGHYSTPGWLTGRMAVELMFTDNKNDVFEEGQLHVWQARSRGTSVCDTFLLKENTWIPMTAVEDWPIRCYVIQGTRVECPDILIRTS